mgnify:FL=1
MLGTYVNTAAIIAGSLLGLLLKGGIAKNTAASVMHAIGLAVVLIGLRGAFKTEALLVVIGSLAVGTLLGEYLRIEQRLEGLGTKLGSLVRGSEEGFSAGFVTASLVFCVGAMAIVGSLESGLAGNHQTLFAKSALDGVASIIFASTLGVGVLFSSISVLIYQGGITLGASLIRQFLTPEVVNEMSAVGGLLIFAIGINLLEIRKLKIGNMLPALFMPLGYYTMISLLM